MSLSDVKQNSVARTSNLIQTLHPSQGPNLEPVSLATKCDALREMWHLDFKRSTKDSKSLLEVRGWQIIAYPRL